MIHSPSSLRALVLCGGKGTRLQPLTDSIPKQLLPLANRPILFYALDHISAAGIGEVGIVISPNSAIPGAVGAGSPWGLHLDYIVQEKPRGIAHGVSVAKGFLREDPFLLFLGDNFLPRGVRPFVKQFLRHRPQALLLLKEVADPRPFGVAELDAQGRVVRVVEKPQEPPSNLILTGIYLFSPAIHTAIATLRPSRRGELEITDAIQQLIERGGRVESHILQGPWVDTGTAQDLLKANRIALEKIAPKVEVAPDSVVENCHLIGPVAIGPGCVLKNSQIGPYVSVGAGTVVENCHIEHAILLAGCHITGPASLSFCLLNPLGQAVPAQGRAG